jgi:hypothetical protein
MQLFALNEADLPRAKHGVLCKRRVAVQFTDLVAR